MKKILISCLTILYLGSFCFLCIFYVPFIEYTNSLKKHINNITYNPLWYTDNYYYTNTCSEISVIRLLIEIVVLTVIFAGLIYLTHIITKNNKKI